MDVDGIGSAQSDASGTFSLTTTNMVSSSRITVAAVGYLTREVVVSWPDPTIDVIPDVAPFSLSFYRQFVRNGHEQPTRCAETMDQATNDLSEDR